MLVCLGQCLTRHIPGVRPCVSTTPTPVLLYYLIFNFAAFVTLTGLVGYGEGVFGEGASGRLYMHFISQPSYFL